MSTANKITTYKDDKTLVEDFKRAAERLSEIFSLENVIVAPYHDKSLPYFMALSADQKSLANRDIHTYLTSLEHVLEKKWTIRDDKKMLWSALKFLNLRPTSDIFDLLTSGDTIEIYNRNGFQIWRNLEAMRACSFTFEEVFCTTWQERYDRCPTASEQILAKINEAAESMPPKSLKIHVKNILTETFSSRKIVLDAVHNYISPLTTTDSIKDGFIVTSTVKILESKISPEIKRQAPLNLL